VSLDHVEGRIYVEPINQKYLDNMYNMNENMNDYVKPTTDGVLSWICISSCMSYSEEYLENWQQILHEVSTSKFGSFCNGHFNSLATLCRGYYDESWVPQTSHHILWKV